jgi:thiosulfate/3-mercaptopyruvate sulfurtransferase
MFKAFGHHKASILDGGLPRWDAEGFPVEKKPPVETKKSHYPTPTFDKDTVRSRETHSDVKLNRLSHLNLGYQQMLSNSCLNPSVDSNAELVVDARSRVRQVPLLDRFTFADTNLFDFRYLGTDPEPRPGLSSGHIPHSLNIPFTSFLQTHTSPNSSIKYTTYRTTHEIGQALVDAVGAKQLEQILKGERSIITSCGSGMTAGILWLGLKLLGVRKVGLYDEVNFIYIHVFPLT